MANNRHLINDSDIVCLTQLLDNGLPFPFSIDIETGKQTATEVSYRVGQTSEQVSAKKRWLEAARVA